MRIPTLPISFSVEEEVKEYYRSVFRIIINGEFDARFKTDGLYNCKEKNIKMLSEFKYGGNLLEQDFFVRCVIQVLCYIKKVEAAGELPPNIIFIGNHNHFCIFDSSILEKYIDYISIDMIPSKMFLDPPEDLKVILTKELKIQKYMITHLHLLKDLIKSYEGKTTGLKMTITDDNIVRIFENFITSNILVDKLGDEEQVALFASIIFGECHDIVGKPAQIVTPLTKRKVVKINRDNYDAFLLSINSITRPSSKREITSQQDRLINEVSRRFHGEFYTPKIWVDEAHKMISEQFGENWKEEYVVWDPASGTGNLTRDYQFKELYCSTLFQSDIDIMVNRGYNPEAVRFQYDFLNDDVTPDTGVLLPGYENKLNTLAPGLVKALEENRPIIIFMNPPYGSSIKMIDNSRNTKGSTQTYINKLMKTDKLNQSCNQLYCQFLYRLIKLKYIYNLSNLNICAFLQPTFLKSPSFREFRVLFRNNFELNNSFLFNAGDFSDVSKMFGILFGIWTSGYDINNEWKSQAKYIKAGYIYDINDYLIYNADNLESLTSWYNEHTEKSEINNGLTVTNAISIKDDNGRCYADSIGFLNISSYTGSFITSSYSISSKKITIKNFYICCSIFNCYLMTDINWINIQNPFLKPAENDEFFKWQADSIVNSVFSYQSRQDAMRNLPYRVDTVINQFFWLPNELLRQLADDHGFDELYQDTISFNQERFVYQELQKVQLSPDAQEVLDKATELVIKSFPYRKELHDIHPEWHLNAWDAGWYQIKLILKEKMKDELKEFVTLYKKFEDRMREGVYKFGFLK